MQTRVRLTREDQKAQTRTRLVESAHAVFLRRGFHAATLDEIALEAGVTKGAVYSNFESKAELFLAVVDVRMAERIKGYRRSRYTAGTIEDLAREHVRIMLRDDPDGRWSSVLAEAWAVAAGDERFRARLLERNRRTNAIVAEAIQKLAERSGLEFALPLAKLARLGGAAMRGLLLQRLLDPQGTSLELIQEALVAFVRGMVRPRPEDLKRGNHGE